MCVANVWIFPGCCKCFYYATEPQLCDEFKADCRNQGIDYHFEKTLCVVEDPYKAAYCHLDCTLGRGEESLAFVGRYEDPDRRPYGLTCNDFDSNPETGPQYACPLHGVPSRVPLYGELILTAWDDIDIIGHRIKDGNIEYYKWEKKGADRKRWIKPSEVDGDELLERKANDYHEKTKKGEANGKVDTNTKWPKRDDLTWGVRLDMLRKDPVEIKP